MAKGKKSVFFCQNCGHEEGKMARSVSGMRGVEYICRGKDRRGVTKGSTQGAKAVRRACQRGESDPA